MDDTRVPRELRRDRSFFFWMNVHEDRLLRDAARAAGMGISSYIRWAIARSALDPAVHTSVARPR
jgi:hypothetical protein